MPSVATPVWRSFRRHAVAAGDPRAGVGRRCGRQLRLPLLDDPRARRRSVPWHAGQGCYQFRLTRNADLRWTPRTSRTWPALRGELISVVTATPCVSRWPTPVRNTWRTSCSSNSASASEMYRVNGPVNLTRLFSITGLDSHPELQYSPFTPSIPKLLQNSDKIFSVINKQDILLLHLRVVHAGGRPAARGRQGPLRAGDQADAVPLRRQLRDRRRAGGCSTQRQGGHCGDRTARPLRRGIQPAAGQPCSRPARW